MTDRPGAWVTFRVDGGLAYDVVPHPTAEAACEHLASFVADVPLVRFVAFGEVLSS